MKISVRFEYEQHSKLFVATNKGETANNEENVKTDILAVPDTGDSVNCSGLEMLRCLGIKKRHLFPTDAF